MYCIYCILYFFKYGNYDSTYPDMVWPKKELTIKIWFFYKIIVCNGNLKQ